MSQKLYIALIGALSALALSFGVFAWVVMPGGAEGRPACLDIVRDEADLARWDAADDGLSWVRVSPDMAWGVWVDTNGVPIGSGADINGEICVLVR